MIKACNNYEKTGTILGDFNCPPRYYNSMTHNQKSFYKYVNNKGYVKDIIDPLIHNDSKLISNSKQGSG